MLCGGGCGSSLLFRFLTWSLMENRQIPLGSRESPGSRSSRVNSCSTESVSGGAGCSSIEALLELDFDSRFFLKAEEDAAVEN